MNNVGYKIVANTTPTKNVAPYLGLAIPAGSLAYDNILTKMVASGTHMTASTAKYLLEASYELMKDIIREENVRIALGSVTVYPSITGSFPSEDAPFDEDRNALTVEASYSQALQSQVGALTPQSAGATSEASSSVKMHTVYDLETMQRGVIRGAKEFRIAGIDLAVPDASDESLELWAHDMSAKVSDVTIVSNDGGQQVKAALPATGKVAKGRYKLCLKSHGLDPSAPLATVTLAVTVTE